MRGPLPGLTSKSAGGHAGRGLSADYTLPNGGTWAFYLVLFLHLVSCCLFCTRSTTYRLRRCRASSLNGKRRCSMSTSVTLSALCCTWRERRRSCSRFVCLFSDQLRYCLCCWSDHFQRHDHSSWCWWQCIRSSSHLLSYHLYPLSPSLCECILVGRYIWSALLHLVVLQSKDPPTSLMVAYYLVSVLPSIFFYTSPLPSSPPV